MARTRRTPGPETPGFDLTECWGAAADEDQATGAGATRIVPHRPGLAEAAIAGALIDAVRAKLSAVHGDLVRAERHVRELQAEQDLAYQILCELEEVCDGW